jgi:hypothetical protein
MVAFAGVPGSFVHDGSSLWWLERTAWMWGGVMRSYSSEGRGGGGGLWDAGGIDQ